MARGFACAATLLTIAIPGTALAHHGGPEHVPAKQVNMELVGELEPTIAQGPIVPGQFADLAVHGDYAYLNSWDEPSCTKGGTYIADISDPANPVEAGFIPAVDGYYHGEGAHVVSIDTPQFTGDLLAVNNEACSNDANRPPGVDAASGGFDLYDVSDPSTPVTLIQNAGDIYREAALPAPQLLPQRLRLAGRQRGLPRRLRQHRVRGRRHLRHHRPDRTASRSRTSTSRSTSPRSSTSSPTATSSSITTSWSSASAA